VNARDLEDRHSSGFYPKKPLALVRGRSARVWDEEGREYLDFTSGHGVAVVGHAHPAIAAAVARQMGEIVVARETFYHPLRAELAAALASRAGDGLDRVFLCNSGAEATECALKVARLATGRPGFVALKRGFHGRTLGALSVTWEKKYREPFEPLVPGVQFVGLGRVDELEQAVGPDTAALILEIVQGEGGVHPAQAAFLHAAREITRARGALLIVDEVQTGVGRTGRMLAKEHSRVAPDILTLGKGLGGGLPVGAALFGPAVPPLPSLAHGSTLGGGPVVCAAALATLEVIEREGLVENSRALGEQFLGLLSELHSPLVRSVRGLGLMVGVELKRRSGPYLAAMMRRGVLALSAGPTVIRFLPPLTVDRSEIDRAAEALALALEEVGAKGADATEADEAS
jgi:acetylornithine/LysW-gamma-L-lysine aminotransferase